MLAAGHAAAAVVGSLNDIEVRYLPLSAVSCESSIIIWYVLVLLAKGPVKELVVVKLGIVTVVCAFTVKHSKIILKVKLLNETLRK